MKSQNEHIERTFKRNFDHMSSCRCYRFPAPDPLHPTSPPFHQLLLTSALVLRRFLLGNRSCFARNPCQVKHTACTLPPPTPPLTPVITRFLLLPHRCRVPCFWMGQTLEQFMLQSLLWNQAEVRVPSSLPSFFPYLASLHPF